MSKSRTTSFVFGVAMLCAGCISTYHEPKQDISAIDGNLARAADGDAQAQQQLATAFGGQHWNGGRGVGFDPAASQRYLLAAAERNNVLAQIELGRRYFNGTIVNVNQGMKSPAPIEKDYDAALYWLYRAARQHNAGAYGELRAVYERPGTPLFDLIEACKWEILRYPATNYCEQKKLNPEQITRARRLAGEWLTRN